MRLSRWNLYCSNRRAENPHGDSGCHGASIKGSQSSRCQARCSMVRAKDFLEECDGATAMKATVRFFTESFAKQLGKSVAQAAVVLILLAAAALLR